MRSAPPVAAYTRVGKGKKPGGREEKKGSCVLSAPGLYEGEGKEGGVKKGKGASVLNGSILDCKGKAAEKRGKCASSTAESPI